MICVCCGATMSAHFTKKEFDIERCSQCGLMSVKNVPQDLAPFYAEGYFTGDVSLDGYMDYDQEKEVSRKIYTRYLEVMEKFLGKNTPHSLFELGCATGFFLDIAQTRGWYARGADISEYAVAEAQRKGLHVVSGTVETMPASPEFGAVVMQDVIEHVKDPVDTIRRAWNMLSPGGLFVLTTPDAGSLWARMWGKRWHAFVPPQHLFYFSQANLVALVERQGFENVHAAHHGKWFTLPYIMRLLYSWVGWSFFSTLANWTARSRFLSSISVPINVRDTLFLIARKPD